MFVAECKLCGAYFIERSEKALRRDIVLHYSVHYCEKRYGDRSRFLRGICVKEAFEAVRNDYDVFEFFVVKQVQR